MEEGYVNAIFLTKIVHNPSLYLGTPFPSKLRYPASVPHGNSFVLLGGYAKEGNTDRMYKYEELSGKWRELSERISRGGDHAKPAFRVRMPASPEEN